MKSLSPAVEQFAQHLRRCQKEDGTLRYTERTVRAYALLLERALAAGDPLELVRRAETTAKWMLASHAVIAWARWRGDETLRKSVRTIGNPGQGTREVKPPPLEDWRRIVAVVDGLPEPERSLLAILTSSGLRFGDIAHITRPNAMLAVGNQEIVIQQKGGKVRSWAPGSRAREAFRVLAAIPGWTRIRDLVIPAGSRAVTDVQKDSAAYDHIRSVLKEVCRKAGVEFVRFHRFRHGASDVALRRGATPEERRKLLGHSTLDTTIHYYTHTEAVRQRQIADGITDEITGGGK